MLRSQQETQAQPTTTTRSRSTQDKQERMDETRTAPQTKTGEE